MHPLIIFLLLLAALLFINWCKHQSPEVRTRAIIYAALTVVALLVLTGRMHWLMGVIGAGIALFQRLMTVKGLLDRFKSAPGPARGKTSGIETRFFRMFLDHDSGALSGTVLAGQFKGTALDDLQLEDLTTLLDECRIDHQSLAVLESYLDQRFVDQWRTGLGDRFAGLRTPPRGSMTREEAVEILGVALDASKEDVVQAHRRLMQRLHPDRGGSNYLAARINQAKDLLLGACHT